MTTCRVDGCERPSKTKGLCQAHYMRLWSTGHVGGAELRPYGADKDTLFWRCVDKRGPNDCWEWTAHRSVEGYGKANIKGAWVSPHRFSYELVNGPIPAGLTIDHLCLNKACVNPAHLEAVTNAENRRRAAALQTHCKRGHELSGDNVRIYKRSSGYQSRTCVACARLVASEYYYAHKAT